MGAGRKRGDVDKRQRTITLPTNLDRRLREHAAREDRPVSEVIADAITAYLKMKPSGR